MEAQRVRLQNVKRGATAIDAVPLNYAGLWVRLFAGLLDFAVLLIPFSTIVSFAAVGLNVWNSFFFDMRPGQPLPDDLVRKGPTLVWIGVFVLMVSGWLYFGFLESSAWRGTLGKHMLGLYVGDEKGEPIGFWKATRRFLGGRFLMHVPVCGSLLLCCGLPVYRDTSPASCNPRCACGMFGAARTTALALS
jgi:uncharacterized RDD family membrane protein YckC